MRRESASLFHWATLGLSSPIGDGNTQQRRGQAVVESDDAVLLDDFESSRLCTLLVAIVSAIAGEHVAIAHLAILRSDLRTSGEVDEGVCSGRFGSAACLGYVAHQLTGNGPATRRVRAEEDQLPRSGDTRFCPVRFEMRPPEGMARAES